MKMDHYELYQLFFARGTFDCQWTRVLKKCVQIIYGVQYILYHWLSREFENV